MARLVFETALLKKISIKFRRQYFKSSYNIIDENQTPRVVAPTGYPDWNEAYPESSAPMSDFPDHVQRLHADGDIGFSKEYEDIQQSCRKENLSHEHCSLPDNKSKNRYLNIVACESQRGSKKWQGTG